MNGLISKIRPFLRLSDPNCPRISERFTRFLAATPQCPRFVFPDRIPVDVLAAVAEGRIDLAVGVVRELGFQATEDNCAFRVLKEGAPSVQLRSPCATKPVRDGRGSRRAACRAAQRRSESNEKRGALQAA